MRLVRSTADIQAPGIAGGVFVPTMGALHAGHAALIHEAVKLKHSEPAPGPVVVSIFVNPTQFNDKADLLRYPRTLDADLAICAAAGAEVVFAPNVATVYPPGPTGPAPPLPPVATEPKLEDALRPGHFAGVCQVVSRLFELVRPAMALFGEKDWQQFQVIRAMVHARTPPYSLEVPWIVGVRTVREPDGLAMSSRNRFLTPHQREQGAALSRALFTAASAPHPHEAEQAMLLLLTRAGLEVQYAVVRDAQTLLTPRAGHPCRALIAARLGSIRLIDNAPWPALHAV